MKPALSVFILSLASAIGCGGDDPPASLDAGTGLRDAAAPDAPAHDASLLDGAPPLDAPAPIDGFVPSDAATSDDLALLDALLIELPTLPSMTARWERVRTFMNDRAYGPSGFPLRRGREIAFVFWDPDEMGGPLHVAGEFNGWNSNEHAFERPVADTPLYVKRVALSSEPAGLYKFIRNGSEYFADPWARRLGHDEFGRYSLLAPRPGESHLEWWPSFRDSSSSVAARDVFVYVPRDLTAAEALPVLYAHDGQNLFEPDAPWGGWRAKVTLDDEIAAGRVRRVLLVAIPNTPARFDEYTHVTDDIGGGAVGGNAAAYLRFIAEDLVPWVDRTYPTDASRTGRVLVGSSLGGLVSLIGLQSRSDTFANALAMSSTVGWGSIGSSGSTVLSDFAASTPADIRLYLDTGGGPGSGCVDTDSDGVRDDAAGARDNHCENLQLADLLRTRGLTDGTTLHWVWSEGAEHNEAAWAARLPGALRALVGSTP